MRGIMFLIGAILMTGIGLFAVGIVKGDGAKVAVGIPFIIGAAVMLLLYFLKCG